MDHLWYVQDAEGREIISWRGNTKVADVTATHDDDKVSILVEGRAVVSGPISPGMTDLLRVSVDDKLGTPISAKIKVAS